MSRNTGEENLADAVALYIMAETEHWSEIADARTDSPIERLLLKAMSICCRLGATFLQFGDDNAQAVLRSQAEIGPYRVDFLLGVRGHDGHRYNLVIECDGHDFHERTKEQAAKDRSRDRYLQSNGYVVFRFTGSEIHSNAFKCARQIMEWGEGAVFNGYDFDADVGGNK